MAHAVADSQDEGEPVNWDTIWPVVGAILVAVISSLVTSGFLRRSNKEANDTTAFKTVTDQLFALNETLHEDVEQLRGEVKELRGIVTVQEKELSALREENGDLKRKNLGLTKYVKILIEAWPLGTPPPAPDESDE